MIVENKANDLFRKYVEHSYRYYQLDEPAISDYEFDMLCRKLRECWDDVTHHDKALATESDLEAGTGCQMMFRWPVWVKEVCG